jgi:hypothetical protein
LHYTQSSTASLAVIVFISSLLGSLLPKIPLAAREEYKVAVAIYISLFIHQKDKEKEMR